MRHLITGGSGFIGSHLAERLLLRGDEVICVDNFFTGHRRNVAHLVEHHSFELTRGDVCDENLVWHEVDRVWHLACPASPIHYQRNPAQTIQTGVVGTINALKVARKCRARIFVASTSEVYGDPLEHPQREGYLGNVNCFGPRACYDEGKRAAEALTWAWVHQFGVDARIARIFNTYGPRMAVMDGRVVSNFIVQALRGEEITVYGDGKQTRSFMYVDDLVDGIMALMERGADAQPVNLGNPVEFSMLELLELVREKLPDVNVRVVHKPLPTDDPRVRRPDITRAISLLGWTPRVPLETGLERTIEYFRGVLAPTG